MRCTPFDSAASELVDERLHPVEQLRQLDEKAREREDLGDMDWVIECRIKQLSLHKVLVHLHGYPLPDLIRAQAMLAEAYARGGYHKQACDHLVRAREANIGGVLDDAQGQRLKVDILIAEGTVHLAEDSLEKAEAAFKKASSVGREVLGDMGTCGIRVHSCLGRIAMQRGQHAGAVEHFAKARDAQAKVETGTESEEFFRLDLRVAEAQYACQECEKALDTQTRVVNNLRRLEQCPFPELLVEALAQQARWFEARGGVTDNQDALEALKKAEEMVEEETDPRALNIKRDIALIHLKLGAHEEALKYLNEVHYLERCMHGSTSISVGRTLKALGTVHLVRQQWHEAHECLSQALHIFESDHPPNRAIIRDIHAKLNSITWASG